MDPEKHGINIGLKIMSNFRQLHFMKAMRNVIRCLKILALRDLKLSD